jgi:iron complex transport system substrate-binding protein
MNLCTDQLAMLVAAPGQLASISVFAADPAMSVMAAEARDLPSNRGRGEEIFLLAPDLVLAGAYTTPATIEMLRRLDVRVETFAPAASLADIRKALRRMGVLLGQEARAETQVAAFDAALETARRGAAGDVAALYEAQGYSSGADSLPGAILAAAGYANAAGKGGGTFLPLETLIATAPDVIVSGRVHRLPTRAEDLLGHPALASVEAARAFVNAAWICGTPAVVGEVRRLARLAEARP